MRPWSGERREHLVELLHVLMRGDNTIAQLDLDGVFSWWQPAQHKLVPVRGSLPLVCDVVHLFARDKQSAALVEGIEISLFSQLTLVALLVSSDSPLCEPGEDSIGLRVSRLLHSVDRDELTQLQQVFAGVEEVLGWIDHAAVGLLLGDRDLCDGVGPEGASVDLFIAVEGRLDCALGGTVGLDGRVGEDNLARPLLMQVCPQFAVLSTLLLSGLKGRVVGNYDLVLLRWVVLFGLFECVGDRLDR